MSRDYQDGTVVEIWGRIKFWRRVPDKAPVYCTEREAGACRLKAGNQEFEFELPRDEMKMRYMRWALDHAVQAGEMKARAEVRAALGVESDPWNGGALVVRR